MSSSQTISVNKTRADLAQSLIKIDGKQFSLRNYPMFTAIYNSPAQSTLLMTCRQVGKSTTLATFNISESIALDHFRTYFIAPSREQTHKYSTLRVGKMITYSPLIKDSYSEGGSENRVNLRMFSNGSEIAFTYAQEDADRCRGYSCDRLCMDEIQDMLLEAIEPVVRECLSNSSYKLITRCGTPKSLEHDIHEYWLASTQTEWMMKCSGCNKYNYVHSVKSIGKRGPICTVCGKDLNPREGVWVDTNPGAPIKGFHISRPMMPKCVPAAWNTQAEKEEAYKEWLDILDKLQGPRPYSEAMFLNEVLGVSFSLGTRFLTRDDLLSACDGPPMGMKPSDETMANVIETVAGVDWSGGGTEIASMTALWVLARLRGTRRYRTLYYKVFNGTEPLKDVAEIASTLGMMPNMRLVLCDAGEGNMNTEMLRSKFDNRRVFKVRYGDPKYHIKYNTEGRYYYVNRTWAIDSLMASMKHQEIQFTKNKDAMDTAFDHILAEYTHVTKMKKKVWRHSPTKPDDCLHALNFARIAAMIVGKELDLTSH